MNQPRHTQSSKGSEYVEITETDNQSEIGPTESELSSEYVPEEERERRITPNVKNQRILLAKWLAERDYPNKGLDFLPYQGGLSSKVNII